MAFNPLEYLEQGKVDFLFDRLGQLDRESLIKRIRNSENRLNIVNGFLPKLKRVLPRFCFEIIYDMDEFTKDTFDLVSGRIGIKIGYKNLIKDEEKIRNILNNTKWGKDFVYRNLHNILMINTNNINPILEYLFSDFENNLEFIKHLSIYHNLHIRYIFMKYLIIKHYDKISLIYDDITKYLIGYSYTEGEQLTFLPKTMKKEDISELAITAFRCNYSKELWYTLKEYILSNYPENDLAYLLFEKTGIKQSTSIESTETFENIISDSKKQREIVEREFALDADRLFLTSSSYKFSIYRNYSKYISKEILEHFKRYLKYFEKDGEDSYDFVLSSIFSNDLWNELIGYIDKYLSLSKSVDFRFLMNGSTSSCYKIGDYVFKLNRTKWSYEDVICPNLYLIIKNLEEHYIRDKYGVVKVGIEVQKFLSRTDIEITKEHLEWFSKELRSLGYYVNDRLMYGPYGNNVALLDSYKDADCFNPELLPDKFKEVPLVLIDRDMVYKVKNKRPKQLRERWS